MLKNHLLLIIANIFWGSSFLATKLLLENVPPITIAVLRFFIATLILYVYIKLFIREPFIFIKRDTLQLILLGLCGITIYYCTENVSLVYISTSVASLILLLIPAITTILSIYFFDERVRRVNWIGIIVAFTGAAIIVLKDQNLSNIFKLNIGYLYILISAIAFSIYSVLGKKILIDRSPIQTTTLTFFWGTLLLIPISIIELYPSFNIEMSFMSVINLLYLTIICSIGGYFCWNIGLRRIESGKAAIYINIIPLTAVTLGVLILKEQMSFEMLGGGGMILIGIYLTSFKSNSEEIDKVDVL